MISKWSVSAFTPANTSGHRREKINEDLKAHGHPCFVDSQGKPYSIWIKMEEEEMEDRKEVGEKMERKEGKETWLAYKIK